MDEEEEERKTNAAILEQSIEEVVLLRFVQLRVEVHGIMPRE